MPARHIEIPEDLLSLKPSGALESVPMSQLARKGSAVLRKLMVTAQAMSIRIQGQGAMVTLSEHQYDEMVELIRRMQEEEADDGFTSALSRKFDDLVAGMNQKGAVEAAGDALFGDPDSLNKSYQPGATEHRR